MIFPRIIKNILFVFILLFCILATAEITLRTLGYLYSNKPSFKGLYNTKDFSIICLGDSFTYGWGVSTDDSYPRQLERMLNQNNPRMHFKVFNLGVPGSNSSQQLLYLENTLGRYKEIDLAIILTGANDYWNFADSNIYKFMNHQKDTDLTDIRLKIFLSNFRIYKMLKIISLNLKRKVPESRLVPSRFDIVRDYKNNDNIEGNAFRRLIEYNLSQMIHLARSYSAGIILQNYPIGDLSGGVLKNTAGKFSVPFVDNFSLFREQLKKRNVRDLFIYDNSHPNAEGYKIMVEELYKIIVKNYLK